MAAYPMPIRSILRSKLYYVLAGASILPFLLSASNAGAQIAIGEINGAFPVSGRLKSFHGYAVFLEMPSQSYFPIVTNPPTGSCPQKFNAPLLPTYQWAQQTGAFLALNGSFGDPEAEYRPGDCRLVFGPVKSNGVIVAPVTPRPDGNGNPSILFSKEGTASIKMARQADVDNAYSVISGQWEAGPQLGSNGSLLIENGTVVGSSALPVPDEVAPRTAVGLTASGTLILVMIEGRLPDSDGITLPYLAELLKLCGAYNAINLDGGGSSTMTYMPDPRVPMRESLALYNLMRSSQYDGAWYFKFTQHDPRVPFASRPSDLIPPSNPSALNLLYRPVTIHFGFVLQQAQGR
jgi:hypothetical protein